METWPIAFSSEAIHLGGGRVFLNYFLNWSVVALQCCFVSAVQPSESAICVHSSPLPWVSFLFRSPWSTEQSSLHCKAGSHQLSSSHIVSIVCMSVPVSQPIPAPFPPWNPCFCSLTSVSLFLLFRQIHLYHLFRVHVYVLIYNICVSLSDLFHSV